LRQLSDAFDVDAFPGVRLHEMKIELIRLLAAHPTERPYITTQWSKQFPGEEKKFGIAIDGEATPQ
jgi:hypothetical protein